MTRRGDEYLESLKDGRQVWLAGELVDVTTHPALAGCAQTVASIYDLQHDPAWRDVLTMESPESGDRVSLGYLLPRSTDDLGRRRRMIELLMRRGGAVMGRLPEYMALIMVGLYDTRQLLGEEDQAFCANVEAYFSYCRENDLALTHGFGDPPRARGLPLDAFERLKVVDQGADGITIRGVKSVATLAPYANEFLGLTAPAPELKPEEIVYFGVPINASGVHLVCREPLASQAPQDHPLSARYDEMDAWVVFDDVFVPRERVFYLRRADMNNQVFARVLAWASYHVLTRVAVKAEVLLGICAAVTDYLGTSKTEHSQIVLSKLIAHVEALRALLDKAEAQAVPSPSGLLLPNPALIQAGRVIAMEQHPKLLQLVREACGSGLLMAPRQADLDNPRIGAFVARYVAGQDERALERYRLLRLAWDYLADGFGSRQLLFEMYNANTLPVSRQRLLNNYDTSPYIQLAKELAGIAVS